MNAPHTSTSFRAGSVSRSPLPRPETLPRLAAALAGKPFVLTALYSDDEWEDALQYYRDSGDGGELEWMLARDEAHERYSDWLGRDYERRWSTEFDQWLPRNGYEHLVSRRAA